MNFLLLDTELFHSVGISCKYSDDLNKTLHITFLFWVTLRVFRENEQLLCQIIDQWAIRMSFDNIKLLWVKVEELVNNNRPFSL